MKQHALKISIVTPSFNQAQFIRETIDSVLDQKYPNLEYLVMDGGSTDQTTKILQSYGSRIKWISKKDKGQTDAINKGMKLVNGEIVAYLNSDDVMAPGTLAAVGDFFSKNKDAHWFSGEYIIIDTVGKPIQWYVVLYKKFFRSLGFTSVLYILNYINQPSTFWRRSIFDDIGYFDTSLRYCMDYDFWLRCAQKYQLYLSPQVFSKFRIHATSKGGSAYKKQFQEEEMITARNTSNVIFLLLHKLHTSVIVSIYNLIK